MGNRARHLAPAFEFAFELRAPLAMDPSTGRLRDANVDVWMHARSLGL